MSQSHGRVISLTMNIAFPTQEVGDDSKLKPKSAQEQQSEMASSNSTLPVLMRPNALTEPTLSGEESPTNVSIANSLLSFKQTSPITSRKVSTDGGMCTNSKSVSSPQTEDTSSSARKGAAIEVEPCTNNSNFWLQEEEERFLLGLRMYGWGQWKRIQFIVKTRTNKQIKSHAQKREKVNPAIKTKYSKGTCRRGRISSGVLANDAKMLSTNSDDIIAAIASDDQQFPPLEQMVKDVYQTNNGDGPNSRVRRYRHTPYHRSTHHLHATKAVKSSSAVQESSTVTGTEKLK